MADINLSVFYYTIFPGGLLLSVPIILLLISFQGAFLNKSLSSYFGPGIEISNTISIVR
jgi:hypothetical protein